MAERRKNKKKKEVDVKDADQKPSNDEYAVAKYLKQKLPEKKTALFGHKVEYFIASKAIDCLLDSPWAKETKKNESLFHNRDSAVNFMARLLEHKFFHRAKKIIVQKESKKKKKDSEETAAESGKEKESKKAKSKSDEGDKKEEKEGKKESSEATEKKKKKIKLDMHLEQVFVDSNEPYVWIYDPIPLRTWVIGTLMVIAAVLICLFPLWPQTIRHYIYYLSVAAAFFLVFIIGLAVFRLVFFVLIWVVTFGKHHLWLLPNLTEDVGFFESFWPLYKYEYKGTKEKEKDTSKEKRHKDKSDNKEESQEKEHEKSEASSTDQEHKGDPDHSESEQESESERQKPENGFEFLEAEEANEIKTEEEEEENRKTK